MSPSPHPIRGGAVDNHEANRHHRHVVAIYTQLTRQFNTGQTRAILAGGQAVVMHGLAMMSMTAASPWADAWPATQRLIAGLPLEQAHALLVDRAAGLLPPLPEGPA